MYVTAKTVRVGAPELLKEKAFFQIRLGNISTRHAHALMGALVRSLSFKGGPASEVISKVLESFHKLHALQKAPAYDEEPFGPGLWTYQPKLKIVTPDSARAALQSAPLGELISFIHFSREGGKPALAVGRLNKLTASGFRIVRQDGAYRSYTFDSLRALSVEKRAKAHSLLYLNISVQGNGYVDLSLGDRNKLAPSAISRKAKLEKTQRSPINTSWLVEAALKELNGHDKMADGEESFKSELETLRKEIKKLKAEATELKNRLEH